MVGDKGVMPGARTHESTFEKKRGDAGSSDRVGKRIASERFRDSFPTRRITLRRGPGVFLPRVFEMLSLQGNQVDLVESARGGPAESRGKWQADGGHQPHEGEDGQQEARVEDGAFADDKNNQARPRKRAVQDPRTR